MHQTFSQQGHHARVTPKSAVADDAAFTIIQIQYGGEAEIHTTAAQLGRQHIAAGRCGVGGGELVFNPQLTECAHGRQVGEAIGFKALHTPAFVVHANQQVRAHAFDGRAQAGQLLAALPITAKQNNAACQRVFQAAAVVLGQGGAGDVDDEGGVLGHNGLMITDWCVQFTVGSTALRCTKKIFSLQRKS